MIVWGGSTRNGTGLRTGGRYCAAAPSTTPTPTPSSTPTATATPSATATATATTTPTATPGPIQLKAQAEKGGGNKYGASRLEGATSPNVDIYRNNLLDATQPNNPGVYIDSTGDTWPRSIQV